MSRERAAILLITILCCSSCKENSTTVTSNPVAGSIVFPPGTSPGFLEIGSGGIAYTANYSGSVSIVSLLHDSVISTTSQIVAFPGGIASASGKVYVSDYGLYPNYHSSIKVLDASTANVLGTINVGIAPGMMVKGESGNLFVVCAGNYPSKGKVYAINTVSDAVIDSVEVGIGPSDISLLHQTLYVLHGDRVMKLNTSPLQVVDTAFVTLSQGLYFYAMGIDDSTGDVYLSKVISAGGSGQVEIHSPTGALKRQPFSIGTFPGAFAFYGSNDRGVFIINEGMYPNAGTISYYNMSKNVARGIVGTSAGWITPNDAKVFETKLYIVVNGIDRIEILDAASFH